MHNKKGRKTSFLKLNFLLLQQHILVEKYSTFTQIGLVQEGLVKAD
jgi:hypothetical protein